MVTNPACGELKRENTLFLSPFAPESRGTGAAVPSSPASAAYSRKINLRKKRAFIYNKQTFAIFNASNLKTLYKHFKFLDMILL